MNVVAGLGTNRDKRAWSSYSVTVPLSQVDLEARYTGGWLSGKVVDIPAGDMTREWVELNWDGHDDAESQVRDIASAEAKVDLRGKVLAALKWARLYGGSIIAIALKGEADLAAPLDITKIKKGSLENFIVFDRWEISADSEIDEVPGSPNFERPIYYTIARTGLRIHWTRVVRFGGRTLPRIPWITNGRWDASVLQNVGDAILAYDSARDGAASMVYEAVIDVLKIPGLFAQLGQKNGEAALTARFQTAMLMKGINRTLILDTNEEYEQKEMTFSGVVEILREFARDVCGAADIPMTRLFGQSAAGLNATGDNDVRNYYDKIKADQERGMRAQLMYLYEVLVRSTLGMLPANFTFEFNPLWLMSETEEANRDKTNAERDSLYLQHGVLTEAAIARALLDRGTYPTMTEDDVDLAEELSLELEAQEPGLARGALVRGGVQEVPVTENPEAAPADPSIATKGAPAAAPAAKGATVTPITSAKRAKAGDSLPGDKLQREEDGWHAYAGDKHVGGPYATMVSARRRMRQYDRRRG